MLITRTPVRVSFAGGGTDLPAYYASRGGAVLSVAINKYFYTVLTERGDDLIQVISSDLRTMRSLSALDDVWLEGEELAIPLGALRQLDCRRGFNLFLASEIPPGTGLGSSAAVCVNVLKAASTFLGRPLSKYELAEEAFRVATERLGKPVGKQDEYASAFGGLNVFRFSAADVEVEPVTLGPRWMRDLEERLLLFFTGSARDSAGILAAQRSASARGDARVVGALDELKALVWECRAALERGDLAEFGRLLHEGWQVKRSLSERVSTAAIDELYAAARRAGAVGGKVTCAGGGGFLLVFCEPDARERVRAMMAEAGVTEMHFQFDFGGAKVVYDDPLFDGGRGEPTWRFVRFGGAPGVLEARP